jgi:hypothetical protein
MNDDFIAIPDEEIPQATDPLFQHRVVAYANETNKTVSMWRAIPDDLLDFKPHEKVNTIRAILVHQILSGRRFFAQFVGILAAVLEEAQPGLFEGSGPDDGAAAGFLASRKAQGDPGRSPPS